MSNIVHMRWHVDNSKAAATILPQHLSFSLVIFLSKGVFSHLFGVQRKSLVWVDRNENRPNVGVDLVLLETFLPIKRVSEQQNSVYSLQLTRKQCRISGESILSKRVKSATMRWFQMIRMCSVRANSSQTCNDERNRGCVELMSIFFFSPSSFSKQKFTTKLTVVAP